MEKNLTYNFNDSLAQMQFAELLNSAADFYRGDKDKFNFYSNRAEEAINRSIDASPGRVNVYFIKAQVYLVRGDFDNAIKTIEYAISLNKEYSDGYCYLAKIKMTAQKEDGMDMMNKCVDMDGAATLYPIELVQDLANYYSSNEDYFRAISMAERLMALQSDSAQNWSNLAYLFLAVDMKEKAIIAAKKAAELDPSLRDQAEAFVNSLSE
jgi:tetratricopeptide (TPR) repeat protein